MADDKSMALTESVCKQGQIGGPLRYQLVPAAATGPRHPQGRSEPASGAGRVAAPDGERGRGSLSGWEAVPRRRLELFDADRERVVLLWVSRPKGEPDQWLRV
jgi:hypothetical protein